MKKITANYMSTTIRKKKKKLSVYIFIDLKSVLS